jgi:hypothetical protein
MLWEVFMSEKKYTKEDCLALLCAQYAKLREAGEERYPQRADFEEAEVVAIKAHLGPWPRALEAAGIKPPRDGERLERNREKRIRAKRARNAERNADRQSKRTEGDGDAQ